MTHQPTLKQNKFISLRLKLLLGFTLLFSVVFIGAYYWFYHFATQMAMEQIGEDLINTLNGAAASLNGDELLALYNEGVPRADGFIDDPRYWNQLDWFEVVHGIEPRAWPYAYVPGDRARKEVLFITDLYAVYDPSKSTQFREAAELDDPEANYQGLVTTTLYLTPYADEWGTWVSGYTPIKNAAGTIVAGLGIDFRADYVFRVQTAIRNQVIVAFIFTYALLLFLIYVVASTLTQPMLILTQAALRIGEGDYTQDLSKLLRNRFPDEIDKLVEVFGTMVNKVQHREQKLRLQVEELKIEVDEVKRQRQVSEIVDSDFFQGLQAKARIMRQQRDNDSMEPEA